MSDLLPPNATTQERALSLAIDRDVPTPIRDVWDAATCPANVLPWLAWAFTVDEWDASWTDEQKRAVIKKSIDVHRYKGTIGAVKDALGALFYSAQVQEWFNQVPEGNPYTFRIKLEADQTGITQTSLASLQAVIERTKNLRSHLDRIDVSVKTATGPTLATCTGIGNEISLTNYIASLVVFNETAICA